LFQRPCRIPPREPRQNIPAFFFAFYFPFYFLKISSAFHFVFFSFLYFLKAICLLLCLFLLFKPRLSFFFLFFFSFFFFAFFVFSVFCDGKILACYDKG